MLSYAFVSAQNQSQELHDAQRARIIWIYAESLEKKREERVTVAQPHERVTLWVSLPGKTPVTFISPLDAKSDFSVLVKVNFMLSDFNLSFEFKFPHVWYSYEEMIKQTTYPFSN